MSASTHPENLNPPVLAEIYASYTRFRQLLDGSFHPPIENLGLAAQYISSLFRRHEIPFAFLGGWAMYLRGGERKTHNVDVTVAGCMDGLKAIMLQEPRFCIPQTHQDTKIEVFVHTGGHWDPTTPNARLFTVNMNIIIGGHWGTPPDLPNGTEEFQPVPSTIQGRQAVPVLNLYYQFTTKLLANCGGRDMGGGLDCADLVFLVREYPDEIRLMRDSLDVGQKWTFYDIFVEQNGPEFAAYLYEILGLSDDDIPTCP